MSLLIVTSDRIGVGPQVLLAPGQDVHVPPTLSVISNNDRGITYDDTVGASEHSVWVGGTVYGQFVGIDLYNLDSAPREAVHIGASGSVGGGAAGIVISGSTVLVENYGEVRSTGTAINIAVNPPAEGASAIVNHGTISAPHTGIVRTNNREPGDQLLIVQNYGTIISELFAFEGGNIYGANHIINKGLIVGDILLGSVDNERDLYDGRGGTIEGRISGRRGQDFFRPGNGQEAIDGGEGLDVLDFRLNAAINVALDGSFANTGTAEGDSYTSIEVIFGSLTGADLLRGDSAANSLFGYGANDTLSGAAGRDTLVGGLGADLLTGGTGNDSFYFASLAEAGDVITDFGQLTADDDVILLVAAGFGGGLVAGALDPGKFLISTSNAAVDADDRFIFRSTDATLWFDSNGNGAGGLTLLADLQAGATLTAADIVLV